jgi:hypothetical protein
MRRCFLFLLFITTSMLLPAATSAQTAGVAPKNLPADAVDAERKAFDALRAGNRAEGLALLARAVELGSRSARVYREYASLQPARAEATMGRAVELLPNDLVIRLDYVSVLLASRKSARALEVLTPMTQVPPDLAFRLFHMRASAFLQADRLTDAKEEAARMTQKAMRPEDEVFALRFVPRRRRLRNTARHRRDADHPRCCQGREYGSHRRVAAGGVTRGDRRPRHEHGVRLWRASARDRIRYRRGAPSDRRFKAILVQGGGRTVDLKCGRQNMPVSIGYVPEANAARRTVGKGEEPVSAFSADRRLFGAAEPVPRRRSQTERPSPALQTIRTGTPRRQLRRSCPRRSRTGRC